MAVRMKRKKRSLRAVVPALVALLFILVVWYVADRSDAWADYLFPGPFAVAQAAWQLLTAGDLVRHVGITIKRLVVGFLISMALGGLAAFLMARFQRVRLAIKPYLLGLQSLPSIAWAPLAILWFGLTEEAVIFVTVIGSIFAVTIAFTDALGSVRPSEMLAARNLGSRGVDLVLWVMIPAAVPPLVSGTKQCWSFAWRSLIGAEIIISTAVGLGFLLEQGRTVGFVADVFAVMLVTLFLGLLFEVFVFSNVEKWVRRRWGLSTS